MPSWQQKESRLGMKYYIVNFNDAEERSHFERMVAIINDSWSLFPLENSKGWILRTPDYKDNTDKTLVEGGIKAALFYN